MADATRTAANVALISGTTIRRTAGVALSHGEWVYQSTTEDTVLLADADALTTGPALGPVVSHLPNQAGDASVVSGEQVDIALPGSIVAGYYDLETGGRYYISTNSGEMCTFGGLASGDFQFQCAIALSDTEFLVLNNFTTLAVA